MRQVPSYVIIGNGRMATHFCYYLQHLGLPYHNWSRAKNSIDDLNILLKTATHVLFLIKDDVIDTFIESHLLDKSAHLKLIHFSGSLISQFAYSAHPLQSFPNNLFPAEEYQKIPFIIESEGCEFSELLPGLTNPHYKIKKEEKAYYHTMCVIANNFTTILWQKFFTEMGNKFGLKKEDTKHYLLQTCRNLEKNHETALTGPIARKDKETLLKNLHALNGDEFQTIFEAFIKTFMKGK